VDGVDVRRHPGLLAQLERARDLGFLGPGPVEAHVDHAQAFLEALRSVAGVVVDLGSGGGVPGLVVAVARPELRLVLLESRAVRCRFLEDAVEALGVDAEVVEGRAEVVGRSDRRGSAAAVIARSFGPAAATAECGAALLQVGGLLVVSEPPPPVPASRWPEAGLAELGLSPEARVGSPAVQCLRQVATCPDAYPRRDGLPAKRPLF
jgi:16S rRNA (guanine527-N7)-methyltransferase